MGGKQMTPAEFMRAYEQKTNTHRFEEVAPLLADNAVYWFNDGSFQGKDAIKQAFEKTWDAIQNEQYTIEQVQWLVEDEQSAVCVYIFRWQGMVEGQLMQGMGRGTSVLGKFNSHWKVIHEHLSALPE
jgi:ketosteroid isomerase-like protein